MAALIYTKCINHSTREAVARCPLCTRFYCRECVTEHNNRMICANCLAKSLEEDVEESSDVGIWIGRSLQLAGALLLLWIAFMVVGNVLLKIPSDFHEGTIWQEPPEAGDS